MIAVKKNKKGFTLVELLIVVGLIGVVLLPISLFFLSNLRHFYAESDRISAQAEAGRIMDLLTSRVIEAEGLLIDGDAYEFIIKDAEAEANDEIWVFKYDAGGKTLEYNTDKSKPGELSTLSSQVSGFIVTPETKTLNKSEKNIGADVTVEVTQGETKYTLVNKVYFRNFRWKD